MSGENTALTEIEMSLEEAKSNLGRITEMFREANDVSCICFDEYETDAIMDTVEDIHGTIRDLILALKTQKRMRKTREDLDDIFGRH